MTRSCTDRISINKIVEEAHNSVPEKWTQRKVQMSDEVPD